MLSAPPTIPATIPGTFTAAFTPHGPGDPHLLTSQASQARALGQRHHQQQARPRHQVWVIKRRQCTRRH
jgi:hypothetical protein